MLAAPIVSGRLTFQCIQYPESRGFDCYEAIPIGSNGYVQLMSRRFKATIRHRSVLNSPGDCVTRLIMHSLGHSSFVFWSCRSDSSKCCTARNNFQSYSIRHAKTSSGYLYFLVVDHALHKMSRSSALSAWLCLSNGISTLLSPFLYASLGRTCRTPTS